MSALLEALASSQRLGMLGARPVDEVVQHAMAFVDALASSRGTVVDLGSGGGVPGLVIAMERPDLRVVLVERRRTRADHLERLVRRLGITQRVVVLSVDAQRLPDSLAPVEAAVARGFAAPELSLRVAAAIVADDGCVVISQPPTPRRWPDVPELELVAGHDRVAVFRRVPRGTSVHPVPRGTWDA